MRNLPKNSSCYLGNFKGGLPKEERKLGLFDNQTYEQQVEILRKAQEEGKLKSNSGFIHEY